MALVGVRVYEVEIVVTSDDGPAETYIDGGSVDGSTEFQVAVAAVNPGGGEIAATIEGAVEIAVDVEGVAP